MYGWMEQNKTVVPFNRITANLFCAAKLLIIKLLIEQLNISIENWCFYLKLAILNDSQWYNARFKLSFFRAVPRARFLTEPLNVFQACNG